MTIREAKIDDISEIMKMAEYGKTKLALDFGDKRDKLSEHIYQKAGTVLVSQSSGEITGFIHSIARGTNYVYVDELYVARLHRGKGIGASLLRALIDSGVNAETRVKSDNNPMINLVKSLGFELVQEKSDKDSLLFRRDKNRIMNSLIRKATRRDG